jgi:16S rRNA (guanine527-N7)-methyltransferase
VAKQSVPPEAVSLTAEAIQHASADLEVHLSDEQAGKLADFAGLLKKWNRVHNLTARDSPAEILSHHLLDSLSIVPELTRITAGRAVRILDVGAGGGLPGVPIAIAMPQVQVIAIDRVQKKTAFIQQAGVELGLPNIEAAHGRVEDYHAAQFDVIASRAFAALAEMVRLTAHLLAPGGCWAAMKGVHPTEEISALPSTVELVAAVKLRVPLLGAERHLVVLRPR